VPTFSERLSELIANKDVTKRALAKGIDVSERLIQYYLSGEKKPNLDTVENMADFFDVSIDYLTGRSDNPAPPARDSDKPEMPPEEMAFFEWVQEHVTGMHFYDFQKAMDDDSWLKGLRLIYEREKGRKPGQKQGE